jgi:hypothetical protein
MVNYIGVGGPRLSVGWSEPSRALRSTYDDLNGTFFKFVLAWYSSSWIGCTSLLKRLRIGSPRIGVERGWGVVVEC